ncbi:hypothetical protein PGT21_012377 [Puccinia graminis f. sp. tritici]|uniref:Uncharacterized protein n=1 Tax=Puccinia graminis f. sp. tritici TaxID=56615 RepID=A0A5B0QIF0_PUCGR|nr:hypothetical protein PGT21_012377 [Puccinia graminis f. sp. tritici]
MKNLQSNTVEQGSQGSNVGGQPQINSNPGLQMAGKQSTQDTGPTNTQLQEIVSLTEVVPAQKTVTAQGGGIGEDAEEREHLSFEEIGGTSTAPDKEDDVVAGRLTKGKC